jgi:hypothetical protein
VIRPLLLLIVLGVMPWHETPANPDVYVVNVTNIDQVDANLLDGVCDTNPAVAGNQCTLRAAIQNANLSPNPAIIVLPLDTDITLTVAGVGALGDLNITTP